MRAAQLLAVRRAARDLAQLARHPLVSDEVIIEMDTLFGAIDRLLTEDCMPTVIKQDPDHTPLSTLSALLRKWHETKYGRDMPNPVPTFCKVIEEVGEFGEAVGDYVAAARNDDHGSKAALHAAEEAADVVIVLWHFVRGLGLDLGAEILHKVQTIYDRLDADLAPAARPPELVTVWDEDVGQVPEQILASLEGK